MQKRLKEKPIRNIEFEPTQTEPGLQSGRIFDEIDELAEVANKQSALLMKWRQGEPAASSLSVRRSMNGSLMRSCVQSSSRLSFRA